MGHCDDVISDVREQIDTSDAPLAEARARLAVVKKIADSFPGALRTYSSGSIAHHTMIAPVTDGDGGLVLDRRSYPELGPDGRGEQPRLITEKLCALLGSEIRQRYPKARCATSKRGPKIRFGEPVENQDPTVDLVVALTRRSGEGLWIPNLEKNTWEASDPEQHAALFNGGPLALRRTRRQVIRLAKAWNRQFSEPAFCSFHLSALALETVQGGRGLPAALEQFFAGAAASLRRSRTADPAGLSPPIKLRISREAAIARLDKAAEAVNRALDNDDDLAAVRASLALVFWDYVDAPEISPLAAAVRTLRPRTPVTTTSLGLSGAAALVKPARAYGDAARS
jgi:hypothetical protein